LEKNPRDARRTIAVITPAAILVSKESKEFLLSYRCMVSLLKEILNLLSPIARTHMTMVYVILAEMLASIERDTNV